MEQFILSNVNLSSCVKNRLYLILELVHPLVNRIRSKWVWSRGKRYFVIAKLDPVKIAWIIREKEGGKLTNRMIAQHMGVSERWVQKLWFRYRSTGSIPVLKKPGRPRRPIDDEERRIVKKVFALYRVGVCLLEGIAMDEPHKRNRRKWIRYERLATTYMGFLHLAAFIMHWRVLR